MCFRAQWLDAALRVSPELREHQRKLMAGELEGEQAEISRQVQEKWRTAMENDPEDHGLSGPIERDRRL